MDGDAGGGSGEARAPAVLTHRRLLDEALAGLLGRAGGVAVPVADPDDADGGGGDFDVLYVHAVGDALADACARARRRWPAARVVAVGTEDATATPADDALSVAEVARLAGRRLPSAPRLADGGLSPRDAHLLELLRRGAGTAEIALELGTTPATARTTIRKLLERLGARSRVEAVALAQDIRPGPGPGDAEAAGADVGVAVAADGPVRVSVRCADELTALLLAEGLSDADVTVTDATVGPAAADAAGAGDADVVLVDAALASGAARRVVEAAKRAEGSGRRAVVLCEALDHRELREYVEAGVDGFVTTADGLDDVRSTLRSVLGGEPAIPPALLGSLLRGLIERHREEDAAIERYTSLSSQERSVLAVLAEGGDHQRIAERLVVSPHTARTHIQNVLRKLDVHSRLEAVALADRYNLLTRFPPDRR